MQFIGGLAKARVAVIVVILLSSGSRVEAGVGNDSSVMAGVSLGGAGVSAPMSTTLFLPQFSFTMYTPAIDLELGLAWGASAPLLGGERKANEILPGIGYHIGVNAGQRAIVQLFGSARLPLQHRSGADLSQSFGVASSAGTGLRLFGCSTRGRLKGLCAGLSAEVRYQVHLTGFQVDSVVFPAGSSILTYPLLFHIGMNMEAM